MQRAGRICVARILSSLMVSLVATLSTAAQDQCVALLQHGIYNTMRSQQAGSSASSVYNQVCSSYNSYKAGSLKADASGNYYMISGAASFSKAEVESIGQAMCNTGYSNDQAASQVSNFSAVVSPEGLAAFQDCVKSSKNGLVVTTQFDENAPELVTLSAVYTPVGSHGVNRVGKVQIQDSNPGQSKVTCAGTLYDTGQNHGPIGTSVLTMACKRPVENDPTKAFPIAGRAGGLAYAATIVVPTDVGAIRFLYGPIFLPPPPSEIPPAFVGEIRAVAFQSSDPGFKTLSDNGWMECDGRALNSADYPELFKALGNTWGTTNLGSTFKIPDLRGQFLRGWNHGANGDPEATSRGPADPGNPHPGWTGSSGDAVGSKQADAYHSHVHSIVSYGYASNVASGGYRGGMVNTPGSSTNTSGASGGNTSDNETRPVNVAVMYMIYTGKRQTP